MLQALLLMFEGEAAWDRIVLKERGFAAMFFLHLLPMMAITATLEGMGMKHWGKWQSGLSEYKHYNIHEIIGYEVGQSILNLAMILVCTTLVRQLGRTFHGRLTYTYTRSFTAVVFGFSPMFLLRLLDPLPAMNLYVTWLIGIALSIAILYHGLPRLLLPDPTHAFGLYMSSAIVLFMASGLVRIITALYLSGNVDLSHSFLGNNLRELMGNQSP
jgi:hypothetical protein